MTTFRQIGANRRNALKSTGPNTETGKQQSRWNAVRHGLTAETFVDVLEDPEDYKAFEIAVASDFDAQTAVERELVLRLASLLWRLRRATAIDTGLLQIPRDIDEVSKPEIANNANKTASTGVVQTGQFVLELQNDETKESAGQPDLKLDISKRFLRLDPAVIERLGRYETALWRHHMVTTCDRGLLLLKKKYLRPVPAESRNDARQQFAAHGPLSDQHDPGLSGPW